ncbi:MAG: 7-carboxy-7-deazaguanine synthase [Cocleimonas sp.]|jgi:7-carboxy-7-deazaguanine synthase
MNAIKLKNANDQSLISISEIFGPTIQGEGALIGTQTVFVRTGGCDYRCSWCDTGYAVLPEFEDQWEKMDAESIFEKIEILSANKPLWITLSGGNPAQQDLEELISLGHTKGYKFSMETQGSISSSWFNLLDQLTLSPKPPSTGMSFKKRGLDRCLDACKSLENVSLKFVVADEEDLIWSKNIADQYPDLPCFVQPCNTSAKLEDHLTKNDLDKNINNLNSKTIPIDQQTQMLWLIEAIQKLDWNTARVLPQLHTWLWGDKTGV